MPEITNRGCIWRLDEAELHQKGAKRTKLRPKPPRKPNHQPDNILKYDKMPHEFAPEIFSMTETTPGMMKDLFSASPAVSGGQVSAARFGGFSRGRRPSIVGPNGPDRYRQGIQSANPLRRERAKKIAKIRHAIMMARALDRFIQVGEFDTNKKKSSEEDEFH
jgi:hypothetical protein